jgi:hypothetical protein
VVPVGQMVQLRADPKDRMASAKVSGGHGEATALLLLTKKPGRMKSAEAGTGESFTMFEPSQAAMNYCDHHSAKYIAQPVR